VFCGVCVDQENAEYKRRERQFLVQKRWVESTWARVQRVQAAVRPCPGYLTSGLAGCDVMMMEEDDGRDG
jgi:hypothetical protein